MPPDFSQYANAANPTWNANLITGHRFVVLHSLGGFSAQLEVEHPVKEVEVLTPEYNALEQAEKLGMLADASTNKGAQQRSLLQQSNPNFDGDSLVAEGLPDTLPVFLMADVRRVPEDEPLRLTVGEKMNKFDTAILNSTPFVDAYRELIQDAVNAFGKGTMDAGTIAGEVENAIPGVNAMVLASIAAAKP